MTIDEESLHKAIAESIRFTADERDNVGGKHAKLKGISYAEFYANTKENYCFDLPLSLVSKEIGKTVLSARTEKFDCVGAEQRINEITNIITDLMKGSGLADNINMITTLNNEAVGLQELVNQHKEISGGGQLANEINKLKFVELENLINEQISISKIKKCNQIY